MNLISKIITYVIFFVLPPTWHSLPLVLVIKAKMKMIDFIAPFNLKLKLGLDQWSLCVSVWTRDTCLVATWCGLCLGVQQYHSCLVIWSVTDSPTHTWLIFCIEFFNILITILYHNRHFIVFSRAHYCKTTKM